MLFRPPAVHQAFCITDEVPFAVQAIIAQLRQDDDPVVQQEALTQLCELLSVSSEEALSMLPVESLVPILVRLVIPIDMQSARILSMLQPICIALDVLHMLCLCQSSCIHGYRLRWALNLSPPTGQIAHDRLDCSASGSQVYLWKQPGMQFLQEAVVIL